MEINKNGNKEGKTKIKMKIMYEKDKLCIYILAYLIYNPKVWLFSASKKKLSSQV
jgi:hypothetical protein